MKTYTHLLQYLAEFFLKWEMFQIVDKIRTHILCCITFFRKSCHSWGNVEKYGTIRHATDKNIIRRMRLSRWIIDYKQKLKMCNAYCVFTTKMVTRTRLNVTLHVHCPLFFFCSRDFSAGCEGMHRNRLWQCCACDVKFYPTALEHATKGTWGEPRTLNTVFQRAQKHTTVTQIASRYST